MPHLPVQVVRLQTLRPASQLVDLATADAQRFFDKAIFGLSPSYTSPSKMSADSAFLASCTK